MTDRNRPADGSDQGEELPARIVALAQELNAPPPTPREEIWLRVQAARRKSASGTEVIPIETRRRPGVPVRRWLAWGAGIAAILAIGIGIGRSSLDQPAPGQSTIAGVPESAPPDGGTTRAYTIATAQHLSRVETFLTTLRNSEDVDSGFTTQARDLLSSTRLLQDAPGIDPRLRRLLSDLEDILVQVAQFDRSRGTEELDFITDGLEARQVLPRVRAAVPADPARAL